MPNLSQQIRRRRLPKTIIRNAAGVPEQGVSRKEAIRTFEARTGLQLTGEGAHAQLAMLLNWVARGVEDAATPATMRVEWRETSAGAEPVKAPTTRGRPALPDSLTRPLRMLVQMLGPADAALALAICDLWPWGAGPDAPRALRRTEQRLSKLRDARREP
jgi:hypothetical protein